MEPSKNWREAKYEETLQEELRGLRRRREADPRCAIEDLEGTLRHLYHMDGADWLGRGQVQDITLAATIAAYELFISEWKAEKPTAGSNLKRE
ncbi:MAG: hypothetical protein LBB98_04170 [Treponema sp.]|jgi:hypothetical protein|nr:hypothetical protein [Treponema sp.]